MGKTFAPTLTPEQQVLMDLVTKDAISDWGAHNFDRISTRVLLRKMIRTNHPDALKAVREYYSLPIRSRDARLAEKFAFDFSEDG
jgi:hypothetical protein